MLPSVNNVRIQCSQLHNIVLYVDTTISEENAASIFRVGKSTYEIYFHSNEYLDHSLVDVMPYSMEDVYQSSGGICDTLLQGNHDCMPEEQS